MRKSRKSYTPSEKVAILRRHLINRVPISDLCDKYKLPPSIFMPGRSSSLRTAHPLSSARAGHRNSHTCGPSLRCATSYKLQRKNEVIAELMEAHIQFKKPWGTLTGAWVPRNVRDAVIDYVGQWSSRTEIPIQRFVTWLGVAASKFYGWRTRHGLANEHNTLVPRDWGLEH